MLHAARHRCAGRLIRCLLNCSSQRFSSSSRQRTRGAARAVTSAQPPPRDSAPRAPGDQRAGAGAPSADSEKQISNRAAFRAIQLDAKVQSSRIRLVELTFDTSAAGRLAKRSLTQGDHRQLTRRYPLYGEVPPSVVRVAGGDQHPRARFVAAASTVTSLPSPGVPEVAFAGRSNVGKSSLINALTLAPVARQSDKPGKTQSLNFYSVGDSLSFVDLPGYGFAFAQAGRVVQWNQLIDDYLSGRGSALKRVIVVLDARHGIKANDREMLKFLSEARVKFQVVLNKTDETLSQDLCRRWTLVRDELETMKGAHTVVHMVSTATGAGIAPLAAELCQLAKAAPARQHDGGHAVSGEVRPPIKLPRKAAMLDQGEKLPARPSRARMEAFLKEMEEEDARSSEDKQK